MGESGWTGEGNRVVGRVGCFEVGDGIRRLLGQSSVTATSAYLGVSDNSALELARSISV